MKELLCLALQLFAAALIFRMVLSWLRVFGVRGALASLDDILLRVTEPVLAPVRRMLPRTGMFDLSFLLVFLLVQVASSALKCRGLF